MTCLSPIPMGALSVRILDTYRAARRSARTVSKMEAVLRELEQTIAPEGETARVDHLTTDGITRWMALACATRSPNTVIGLLGYARAVCSYAVEEGLLERLPAFRRLRPRRARVRHVHHHSAREISELLEYLRRHRRDSFRDHRLFALVALVSYTGLRRDEALWLRRQDLRLEEGYLEVEPHHRRALKTEASAQPVPICPELAEVLREYLAELGPRGLWVFPAIRSEGPWHGGGPGRRPIDALRRAASQVGIEYTSWLTLRRSWAVHAETLWGLSDPQIMRVLRHTTVDTSRKHYRAADVANLRAIAQRVSYRASAG